MNPQENADTVMADDNVSNPQDCGWNKQGGEEIIGLLNYCFQIVSQ